MKLITPTFNIVMAAILFYAGHFAVPSDQTREDHGTESRHTLEFTQEDVFARHNWTAEEVSIFGFYLGMSKSDALENSRRRGLNLIASTNADTAPCAVSACALCFDHVCNGVGLNFGSDNRVDEINIMRPLQDAPPIMWKASATRQFKGQTYLFFHKYSNDLRLKLFGNEFGREGEDVRTRSTVYLYRHLGIKIHVSLSGNRRVPESEADLTVYFVRPTKA